jgi:hypothetical protein
MKPLNPPSILIVDCGSILIHAFESISESGRKFRTIISRSTSLSDLFFEISFIKPDWVVMCESLSLTSQEALGNLMMTHPHLRLLLVSEDSNVLKVLSKQDVLMATSSDLLNIITAL